MVDVGERGGGSDRLCVAHSPGYENDHELIEVEWFVYDALYAYCREATGTPVRRGKRKYAYSA